MARLLTPTDHILGFPRTPVLFLALAQAKAQLAGRTLVEDGRTVVAYVSNGMWVARCRECGLAVAVHPEWDVTVCLSKTCMRSYRHVVVPSNWEDIEAVLLARPNVHNRNWLSSPARTRARESRIVLPDEPIDALIAENIAHGLPARLEAA